MYRLVLLATVALVSKSTAIHNQQGQEQQTLYSQLHAQQNQHGQEQQTLLAQLHAQQQDQLITPLKLQYVAPKAFLTSAGLVAGQVLTTANPLIIPATNVQPLTTGNPRHASMDQLMNPGLASPRNLQIYTGENSQFQHNAPTNFNQQTDLILQRNQQVPTNSQLLSIINAQLLRNAELSSRNIQPAANNQQYVNNIQVENQELLSSNSQIVSPRNTQYFSTVSPQLPDNSQVNQHEPQISLLLQPPENEQRYNRLPATNSIIPELQFTNTRPNRIIIPNSQITSLLNALYQPSYLLMMPPSSYTAVAYYDNVNNQEETNPVQSDSPQPQNNEPSERSISKSNIVERSNSDTVPESDSSGDYTETAKDILKVSYEDNHHPLLDPFIKELSSKLSYLEV